MRRTLGARQSRKSSGGILNRAPHQGRACCPAAPPFGERWPGRIQQLGGGAVPHAALASNHEAQNACEGCSTLVDPVLALAVLAGGSYEIWVEAGQVAGP